MILPHQEDLKDHRPRCWRCRKRVSWFKVYDGPRGGKLCGDCSLSAAAVEVAVLLGIKGGLGVRQLEWERETERGPGMKPEPAPITCDVGAYWED